MSVLDFLLQREDDVSLSDLVALHALRQRPRGIDLDRLNKGQNAKKKKKKKKSQQQAEDGSTGQKTEEDRWQEQMQRGGLVTRGKLNDMTGKKADEGGKGRQTSDSDDDDDDGEDDDDEEGEESRKKESGPRLVKQNNFQGETGTVDVDKHMMAFIEEEMRKRREEAAAATTTSSTSSLANAPTGEAALQSVLSNPEDELYEIAERYRKLQQSAKEAIALAKGKKVPPTLHNGNGVEPTKEEQREKAEKEAEEEEGNVTLSSTMLTSVPEVDLGMSHRLKNIQETERAKRAMEEARRNRVAQPLEEDDQYAAARFFRHRNTIQSDAEALAAARRDAGMLEDNEEDGVEENGRAVKKSQSSYYGKKGGSQVEQAKRPNFQMASDDAAVERFKKRQRNQLKR